MSVGFLGTTIGSLLVASWFATALSGVLLFQAYHYFRGRPSYDHKLYGGLVIFLCLLDLAHVVCIMVSMYHYLIINFGNNAAVMDLPPPLALTIGLTATITFTVQSFFSWRVWKLSRGNKMIPFILTLLLTARLACGWTTTIKAIGLGTFGGFILHVRWIFTAGVALAVASDLLITTSLCYWLNESRSGMFHMDAILDKIILYSIETGALTSIVSIISLICVSTMPRNLVFIAVHFVISKLYINMFLASLNTRNAFRAQKENLHMSKTVPAINFTGQFSTDHSLENAFDLQPSSARRYHPAGGIITSTVTEVHRDDNDPDYDIKSSHLSGSISGSNLTVKIDPGY